MKLSQIISNHKNPFEGRNKDEVWAELNGRPKQHLDKDKILEEMKQELMKRKGLVNKQ